MIQSPAFRRAALWLLILTAGGGVLLQLYVLIGVFAGRGESAIAALWRMLIFFTILTNILVVIASASALRDPEGTRFFASPRTHSAIALYIGVVGIIYSLILRSLWNPQGLQAAADFLIHDATPVLFVAYWLLFVPKGSLRWSDVTGWLIYPLLYLVYALARGAIENFYAYPFIDISKSGYGIVARNSIMMLGLFVGLGLLIVAIDRALAKRAAIAG